MTSPNTTTGDRAMLRRSVYLLWAAGTFALIVAVGVLIFNLERQRSDLEALGFSPNSLGGVTINPDDSRTLEDISLYFAHATHLSLVPEVRRLSVTENLVENSRVALEALIDGPEGPMVPVLPTTTTIRGLYLMDNGELVLDFSRDLEFSYVQSGASELLMVQSIVISVCQAALRGDDERVIRSVRFLFEGSPPQDSFPAHIDLSEPVYPDRALVEISVESGSDV